MLVAARRRPSWVVSLPAVVVAAALATWASLSVETIGTLPAALSAPQMPTVPWSALSSLVVPAIAVAALGALESLLSATVADGMSVGEQHDPDKELFGQGLANLAVPFFGGIPATAAIARTAVNVRSGARSRLAAVVHALVILVVVLALAPAVALIPLAALAGVLIATAAQMVQVSSVRALLRATRGDAWVLVVTATATVVFDLVTAVIIGIVVAGFFALQQVARAAHVDEEPVSLDAADHDAEESALLAEHIVAFRLEGSLFFGAAHAFLLELSEVSDVRVVVLRMSRVTTLDATGASVLGRHDLAAREPRRHGAAVRRTPGPRAGAHPARGVRRARARAARVRTYAGRARPRPHARAPRAARARRRRLSLGSAPGRQHPDSGTDRAQVRQSGSRSTPHPGRAS